MELVELVEAMKSVRMEVYIYKYGNERIIKYQEEHNRINSHFLYILNQLKRKIKAYLCPRHEEEGRPHVIRDNYKIHGNLISDSKTHIYHHSLAHLVMNLYSSIESLCSL